MDTKRLSDIVKTYNMPTVMLTLAVQYLKDYNLKNNLKNDNIQISEDACLLIAQKMEDSNFCIADKLVDLADGLYTKEELMLKEYDILVAIDFKLTLHCKEQDINW